MDWQISSCVKSIHPHEDLEEPRTDLLQVQQCTAYIHLYQALVSALKPTKNVLTALLAIQQFVFSSLECSCLIRDLLLSTIHIVLKFQDCIPEGRVIKKLPLPLYNVQVYQILCTHS